MSRTPPTHVRRALRDEVGFGCPVRNNGARCGNPYLRYHHFDPPWHVKQHHDPGGMIALCGEHHDKADAGAFTLEQLRTFKQAGRTSDEAVRGRFDWMRDKLLAVVGGNFYYETPIPLQIGDDPIIQFERDDEGRFMLNVDMPSSPGEPRVRIERNDWIETGRPTDLECLPSGKLLKVRYLRGDSLIVEFREVETEALLCERYRDSALPRYVADHQGEFDYPLLTVEISMGIVGLVLDLGPRGSRILVPGLTMTGSVAAFCGIGLQLG